MAALPSSQGTDDNDLFRRIATALRKDGYIILDRIFATDMLQILFLDIKATGSSKFHAAGIGRDQRHQLNRFVRRDRISWLQAGHPPAQTYFQWTENLRKWLNKTLFLGLFDYESHYAHYPAGAFYKKHVDAFHGQSNRRLTTILYLNPDWQQHDGGELVMYNPESLEIIETILPVFGRMVLFLSEEFPHEVLPANRSRYSLTGWFRVNNTDGINLDPPE